MSIDFINELENKVDMVLRTVEQLRNENGKLKSEMEKKNESLETLEKENQALQEEIAGLKARTQDTGDKLKIAAEKIQSLIAKIDAA